MEHQEGGNVKYDVRKFDKPEPKVTNAMAGKTKKINTSAKKGSVSPTNPNKENNPSNMPAFNGFSKPQILKPIYPEQSQYQNQIPLQNKEQVNKQYQLKDIVKKAQTTVNFIEALNQTVVKPVIVQEVTTRKPIITPVSIKTPVNFFEGQPLSQEDLAIQNFFKNTTPVAENTEQYKQNVYSYNQHMKHLNNGNTSTQPLPYQYPTAQQTNNANVLAQSAWFPNPEQNNAPKPTENAKPNKQVNPENSGKTIVKKLSNK